MSRRRFPQIFWTPRFLRGSISPTWSHHHLLSTRLMPSSFTTVLHHRVSRKFFANGMKNVGMHLSGGRSLHGFSSSNCYHTSLRPRCDGSKHRTCSSSNTSSSASLRLAHPQHSLAWLPAPSRPNTRPRMTQLDIFVGSSVLPRTRRRSIINLKTNRRQPRNQLPKPQILPPLWWLLHQS